MEAINKREQELMTVGEQIEEQIAWAKAHGHNLLAEAYGQALDHILTLLQEIQRLRSSI